MLARESPSVIIFILPSGVFTDCFIFDTVPTLASVAGSILLLERSVTVHIIIGVSVSNAASAAAMHCSSSISKLKVTPGNATAPRRAMTGSVNCSIFSIYLAIIFPFGRSNLHHNIVYHYIIPYFFGFFYSFLLFC